MQIKLFMINNIKTITKRNFREVVYIIKACMIPQFSRFSFLKQPIKKVRAISKCKEIQSLRKKLKRLV